jgi:hypothetical protein
VPVGAAVAADRPLPEDAQVLARASGPVVVGLASVFNGATEQAYLRDWDVEVAQASRIADPIPWRFGDGAYMDLCVTGGAGGRPGAVRIGLELSRLEGIDREAFPVGQGLPARVRAGVPSSENANASATDPRLTLMSGLPPETVAVERPALRRLRLDAAAALGPDGTTVLRRSSPAVAGAGREIVVLIRAR